MVTVIVVVYGTVVWVLVVMLSVVAGLVEVLLVVLNVGVVEVTIL